MFDHVASHDRVEPPADDRQVTSRRHPIDHWRCDDRIAESARPFQQSTAVEDVEVLHATTADERGGEWPDLKHLVIALDEIYEVVAISDPRTRPSFDQPEVVEVSDQLRVRQGPEIGVCLPVHPGLELGRRWLHRGIQST